jgi:hypothetical protein
MLVLWFQKIWEFFDQGDTLLLVEHVAFYYIFWNRRVLQKGPEKRNTHE